MRILAGLCNEAEVSTGLVVNGRLEAEGGDRTLGLFLNTVPFSLRIQDESWRALVQKAFRAECELLPYRRFPLSEIQKLAGGRQLFEVGFNFVHFHIYKDVAELGHLRLMGSRVYEQHNYTLAAIFGLDPLTEQLSLHLVYDPKVLGATRVAEIALLLWRVLAALVADPRRAACRPRCSLKRSARVSNRLESATDRAPDSERFQPAHTLLKHRPAHPGRVCPALGPRRGHGTRGSAAADDIPGTRQACPALRRPPPSPGRRPRASGRCLPGAWSRSDHQLPRHPQGGRRVSAARSVPTHTSGWPTC